MRGATSRAVKQQTALGEAEERYRVFIKQSSEGVWRFDLDEPLEVTEPLDRQLEHLAKHARLVECNDAMAKMYGYTKAEQLLGKTAREFLIPTDASNIEYIENFVRANYNLSDAESIEIDCEGRRRIFVNNLTGIVEDGKLIRIWGMQRDNTDARRAEVAARFLAEAGDTLSSSLDYDDTIASVTRLVVPRLADVCAVNTLDAEGNLQTLAVAYSDESKRDTIEKLKSEYPFRTHTAIGASDVIRSGKSEMAHRISDDMLRSFAETPQHLELLRALGLRSFIAVPLRASGKLLGVLMMLTAESGRIYEQGDLRFAENLAHRLASAIENARLYNRAQAANRIKDEFLATLSHELRTPLTPITGWLNMIRGRELSSAEVNRGLEVINKNALWLTRLINDLLDMSAILSGKIKFNKSDAGLDAVLREAVDAANVQATAHGAKIVFEPNEKLAGAWIHGDRTRLVQMFWNLLDNAVKFSGDKGKVEVSCNVEQDACRVYVRDNGIGIAPEFLPVIFERFRQADASATRSHGGMGIGLALVKSFAEAHGGGVSVTSAGANRGAEFCVTLPLVATASVGNRTGEGETALRVKPNNGARRGVRVLIVDDMIDTLEMMQMVFSRAGYQPTICEDAFEALRYASTTEFDVLVADIGLPEMSGHELIARLRTLPHFAEVPAIALTGYATPRDEQAALKAGFNAHLAKPVAPADLLEAIEGLLQRKANGKLFGKGATAKTGG